MNEEERLWKDELDTLLGKLVDENLTAAEKARLNEILQAEPCLLYTSPSPRD